MTKPVSPNRGEIRWPRALALGIESVLRRSPEGQRREGLFSYKNWGFKKLRNMKKPDSLQYQLKTLQSERNLAHGSEQETEGGAIKPSAAGADWEYERGSVSRVAAVVASE